MSEDNPYLAPEVNAVVAEDTRLNLETIASGQKMIIYAILLQFGTLAVALGPAALAFLSLILNLGALILGVVGMLRLARGLEYSVVSIVLMLIGMFIPLLGLIILLSLNSRATKALRAGGYTVGLLGASRP